MSYKWDTAHDWLLDKAREWTIEQLYQAFSELVLKLDQDQIQDIFQSEMDSDGYFEEV